MGATEGVEREQAGTETLRQRFQRIRATTEALAAPLGPEDQAIQSMPDASPTKWHRAHTTWFFEEFVLARHVPGYQRFHPGFGYLFNSYYNAVGRMHPRPLRGMLSRPTVDEVSAYRRHVDTHLEKLLQSPSAAAEALIRLGTHHEQQHQELLLTDIKHTLSLNPLLPAAYREQHAADAGAEQPLRFIPGPAGLVTIGHRGDGFHFDNEGPAHQVFLQAFELANRPVSNREYRQFISDGGYRRPELWLSDGWATVQQQCWQRPLYWQEDLEHEFTLYGVRPLGPQAPVCHLSYYEADAYARWAGARLPTEAEWESFCRQHPGTGQFQDQGEFHPRPATGQPAGLRGGVWEWTCSAYAAYPGYRPPPGAVGEYNGKFMCNQFVLRGGSCATPADHFRPGYRNFFYPDARWQFTGLRLARDA
ncbi:MAG: ergothioneine biosynthesis protein EgtB [Ectothiorhodospiraceae bacterium]|nr:ergothioneine biosynthesis protein EgtB [Ectothiorhodospiraceae bacterium]